MYDTGNTVRVSQEQLLREENAKVLAPQVAKIFLKIVYSRFMARYPNIAKK